MDTIPAENMGVTFGGADEPNKQDNLLSKINLEDQNKLETLIRQQLIEKNSGSKE